MKMQGNGIILPENEIHLLQALHCVDLLRHEVKFRNLNKHEMQFIDFMAEIFPDEGLDLVLGQFPKNTTRITALELCLFTSQTASTVITSAQTIANITETTYSSYARQALATATWGAAAAGTGGRKTTYSQITFPTVGVTGATINGFFVGWDTGAGGTATPTICVGQANFDDVTAVVLATNDVIKVTPTIQFNN